MLLDDPVVINIGAGTGTSGLAFLESRDDLVLWTVDISPGGPLGGLQNERNALKDTRFENDPRHHQILANSRTMEWEGEVDMVFVDGDHTDVRQDIDAWLPRVKEGGVIAFHDYDSKFWGGVKTAIDEAMVEYEELLWVDTLIAFRC